MMISLYLVQVQIPDDFPIHICAILLSASAAFSIYLQQMGRRTPAIISSLSALLFAFSIVFYPTKELFILALFLFILCLFIVLYPSPLKITVKWIHIKRFNKIFILLFPILARSVEWSSININIDLDPKGMVFVTLSKVSPVSTWGGKERVVIDNPNATGIRVRDSEGLLEYFVNDAYLEKEMRTKVKEITYFIGTGRRTPSTIKIEYFAGMKGRCIDGKIWTYEDEWYWGFKEKTYMSIQLRLPPEAKHIKSNPKPDVEYYVDGRILLLWDGYGRLKLNTTYSF